jgi:hypothetical protein
MLDEGNDKRGRRVTENINMVMSIDTNPKNSLPSNSKSHKHNMDY